MENGFGPMGVGPDDGDFQSQGTGNKGDGLEVWLQSGGRSVAVGEAGEVCLTGPSDGNQLGASRGEGSINRRQDGIVGEGVGD